MIAGKLCVCVSLVAQGSASSQTNCSYELLGLACKYVAAYEVRAHGRYEPVLALSLL